MHLQPLIAPGFDDPVAGSQSVFRAAMNAMARPGQRQTIPSLAQAPAPLVTSAAALLLALCDFETSVWLDPPLADTPAVMEFVRFHTGVRVVALPTEAASAVISDTARMPALASFCQGTADYPDRSTTLILQVKELKDIGWRFEGPGILGHVHFSAAPLPSDFPQQLQSNRATFPRGVDILFAGGGEIAALPRSARLTKDAG